MWGVIMIIVKLTFLSFVLTAIMIWFIKVWVKAYPSKAIVAGITNKYPTWMIYPLGLLVISDVIGIIASVIWLLFFM